LPPFQASELKSGWSAAPAPIASIIASEFDATGRSSTRWFQTLLDGKTLHGAGLGVGSGAGVVFGVGFGVGLGVGSGAAGAFKDGFFVGLGVDEGLELGMAVGPIAAKEVGPAIDESGPPWALVAEAGLLPGSLGATSQAATTATATSTTMARSPRRSIGGSVEEPRSDVDDPVVRRTNAGRTTGRTRA
jgi:hypothetical protein